MLGEFVRREARIATVGRRECSRIDIEQQDERLSFIAPTRDGEEMKAKGILSPADAIAAAEAAVDEIAAIARTAAGTAHPGITSIDTAMLPLQLDSLDPHTLRQEVDRRNEAGGEHRTEPEIGPREPANFPEKRSAYEKDGVTDKGSGSVDAAVTRSRAKSQQQRELRVREAPLVGAWLI